LTSEALQSGSKQPRPARAAAWLAGCVPLWGVLCALAACGPPDPTSQPSAATTVTGEADVQLQLLAAPNPSYSGEAITVTATVRNVGPQDAIPVALQLQVPADAQVQQQPQGPGWTCTAVDNSGQASCTRLSLASQMEFEVWLALLPNYAAETLSASARVSSLSTDPVLGNNSAAVTVPINFNGPTYRAPALAGGGFGCALAGQRLFSLGAGAWLILGGLAASLLRRRRQRQPDRAPGI
jgi:hypothetical protein